MTALSPFLFDLRERNCDPEGMSQSMRPMSMSRASREEIPIIHTVRRPKP